MLRRIGLGMFLMAASFLCDSIIEVAGHMENGNVTCMFSTYNEDGDNFPINYWWTLIPNLIHGTGYVLVFYSSFEFVVAQTPWQMKGLSVFVLLKFLGIFLDWENSLSRYSFRFLLKWFPVVDFIIIWSTLSLHLSSCYCLCSSPSGTPCVKEMTLFLTTDWLRTTLIRITIEKIST